MAGAAKSPSPLTAADCRRYLEETTFRLRPKDYEKKYPKWPGAVGLEIEMLPVVPPEDDAGVPLPVPLHHVGETGLPITSAALLELEGARRAWRVVDTEDDKGGRLLLQLVCEDDGGLVSFEPGGQVEFSTRPYGCLSDAVKRLRELQDVIDQAFREHGYRITQIGVNPWHTPDELGLQMPKARYRAMDRYFTAIGEYGRRMMRQTCTVQVNLDFGPNEETLAKRYLVSQLMAPVMAAAFAFSPVVDGKAFGGVGFRSRIWRHTDPTHTGLPGMKAIAQKLTRAACIDSYLEFALNAHVVFVGGAGYRVPEPHRPFKDWLEAGPASSSKGHPLFQSGPTREDFATHLTLLFPEVRPRGFLELRSVDCQARPFQDVPAAFWTGVLYDERALDKTLELLLPRLSELATLLPEAERGLAHPTLKSLAASVAELATEGYGRHPTCFKTVEGERELTAFRERFTSRGRTPGDDVVDRIKASGGVASARGTSQSALSWRDWRALEEEWQALVT